MKSSEPTVDPAVFQVQQSYEETMTFFMNSISPLMNKYNACLQTAKSLNARAAVEGPPSPLLKREVLNEAATQEAKTNSEEVLKRHSSAMAKTVKPEEEWEDCEDDDNTSKKKKKKGKARKSKAEATAEAEAAAVEEAAMIAAAQAETVALLEAVSIPAVLLVQLKIIKQEARALGKTFDQIHDWIALNVPTMKEEDNVGVGVMAQVLGEMQANIASIREVYDQESAYVSDRTQLELAVLKSQESKSCQLALKVCDSDAWDGVEKGWRVMMRVVLLAHSTLAKNMKLLRDPRATPKSMLSL